MPTNTKQQLCIKPTGFLVWLFRQILEKKNCQFGFEENLELSLDNGVLHKTMCREFRFDDCNRSLSAGSTGSTFEYNTNLRVSSVT